MNTINLKNKNKSPITGKKLALNYSNSTGNGYNGSYNATSSPSSDANLLMYGGLLVSTEISLDKDKLQNLSENNFYVSEKDFNKLNDSILNSNQPTKNLIELFEENNSNK